MEREGHVAKTTRGPVKRKVIVSCLVVTLVSSCSHLGRNELPSSSPRAPEIRKAMSQTVIPEVDLENLKPEEALQFWSQASRSYHPQHFEFRYMTSYPMTYSMQPTQPGESPRMVSAAASTNTAQVIVRRKNITSKRLLDEICHQANLSWTIMGRVIVVKPRAVAPDTQP
jgi:hypothetical protein